MEQSLPLKERRDKMLWNFKSRRLAATLDPALDLAQISGNSRDLLLYTFGFYLFFVRSSPLYTADAELTLLLCW